MSEVLLIFPVPSEEQGETISPPLSILYVGAYLEKFGIDVRYLDLRVDDLNSVYAELQWKPLVVGISAMTGFQLVGTLNLLNFIKKYDSSIPIVLGGVHCSLLPEQTLHNPNVDFVVIGEGEITMLDLVQELSAKKRFSDIRGLGWKDNGHIVINQPRNFMDLKDSVPPITEASQHLYKFYPSIKVQVARGCPYRCAFCYNPVFNRRKYREKPVEKIEEEINEIKKFVPVIKHVALLADEIGFNKNRIYQITNLISNFGYKFHTAIRAEHVDEELIRSIENNCEEFFIGVESSVPRIRKLIHKDNKIDDVLTAAELLSKSKIRTVWSFMTAFPEQTLEETIADMNFADKLRSIDSRCIISPFFITTPYPGTELFELAETYNYKFPQSIEEWKDFGLSTISMPWVDPKDEYFTDLYGISFILYSQDYLYDKNSFERLFFKYLKKIAFERWTNRKIKFKDEWNLFLEYNRRRKLI